MKARREQGNAAATAVPDRLMPGDEGLSVYIGGCVHVFFCIFARISPADESQKCDEKRMGVLGER